MAGKFYIILTEIGLAKMANSQITGDKVNLVEMAVGDGNGAYYNPTSNDMALRKEVWRGPIGAVEIDADNANWIVIETVIPSTVGGFMVREAAIYDDVGDVIAIGKYPETYKPVLDQGSSKDLYIRMIIEVSNASAVTLKVDPAVIIASRKYVDEKIALAVGPISQSIQQLQNALDEHKAETVTQSLSVNRDLSIAGDQIVSGFTNIPKRIDVLASVESSKTHSIGNVSQNEQRVLLVFNDGTASISSGAIDLGENATNHTRGEITINNDNTITIKWIKAGTGGTGTAILRVIAHYHGGGV